MMIALRYWREQRGMTQWDLAEASGVGYASIARIETGRQDPTVGLLRKLAEALQIHITDFFREEGKRWPTSGVSTGTRRPMTTGGESLSRRGRPKKSRSRSSGTSRRKSSRGSI